MHVDGGNVAIDVDNFPRCASVYRFGVQDYREDTRHYTVSATNTSERAVDANTQ